MSQPAADPDADDLADLWSLAARYPDADAAVAELARTAAVLTLPRGAVHVISDVHGEDKKLRHVINNASGTLRPLVQGLFASAGSTPDELRQEFLTLIFYPARDAPAPRVQTGGATRANRSARSARPDPPPRCSRSSASWAGTLQRWSRAMQVMPEDFRATDCASCATSGVTDSRQRVPPRRSSTQLLKQNRAGSSTSSAWPSRLVRNLVIYELVMGGDFWDRGPRGDRVMDYLRKQPNVSIIWGNHDMAWLGRLPLGHEALDLPTSCGSRSATGNLAQLEEGYGVSLHPAGSNSPETVYAGDPATHYKVKSVRPPAEPALLREDAEGRRP